MAPSKPRLIFQSIVNRRRYFRRFTLAFVCALASVGAYFALGEAAVRGLIDPTLLGVGQIAALVVLALFTARAIAMFVLWLTRRDEELRFFDQGFRWQRGKDDYKSGWSKLSTFREGAHGIYFRKRPVLQWGAHTLKMQDGRVFKVTGTYGDTRRFVRAVRPYVADVTGARMGKALRAEHPVRIHRQLVVYPGGLQAGSEEIPWTHLDVRVKNNRLTVYERNAKGRFKAVKSYAASRVDNLSGFMELVTGTMRNYQPARFNVKTQRDIPVIGNIRYAPGIYRGVSMRSQIDIAFATELDRRKIRWSYESEPIGKRKVVISFALLDYTCRVDVRNKALTERDKILLMDTANTLWLNGNERLMIYAPEQSYAVQPKSVTPLSEDEFWIKLSKP